ncbi:hypothetical protein VIOR3934_17217, partial [Vibrio orientalis CIP 102891 = ATCC 33934]
FFKKSALALSLKVDVHFSDSDFSVKHFFEVFLKIFFEEVK